MKSIRQYVSLALLILFEIAAGVLLLIDPEKVARVILFLFGIVMIVIGGMNLIRFYREKPEGITGVITCMVGVQTVMNVAVVTGMMPTTGLPLPFFSAGGTSIAVLMCAVAVLLNISKSGIR